MERRLRYKSQDGYSNMRSKPVYVLLIAQKKSFNNPHKKSRSMPIMPQALKCVHTKAHVSGPSKNIAVISISRHPGRADEEPSSASICSASIFRYRTVKISLSLQKWATSVFLTYLNVQCNERHQHTLRIVSHLIAQTHFYCQNIMLWTNDTHMKHCSWKSFGRLFSPASSGYTGWWQNILLLIRRLRSHKIPTFQSDNCSDNFSVVISQMTQTTFQLGHADFSVRRLFSRECFDFSVIHIYKYRFNSSNITVYIYIYM